MTLKKTAPRHALILEGGLVPASAITSEMRMQRSRKVNTEVELSLIENESVHPTEGSTHTCGIRNIRATSPSIVTLQAASSFFPTCSFGEPGEWKFIQLQR